MLGGLRRVTRGVKWQNVRNMSSKVSKEEEIKEMKKWKVVSFAAFPVILAMAIYDLSHQHEHGAERPAYPYLRIRNKEFPWGDNALFGEPGKHH